MTTLPTVPTPTKPTPERATTTSVSLTPTLWTLARNIGAGSASRGIQIALRFYAKHNEVREVDND